MSLEKLLEKIRADGRAEAEAMLAEARAEAARIKAEGEARGGQIRLAQIEEAERAANRDKLRLLGDARMAARMRLLGAKRELLDEVVETARRSIEELSEAEYRAWLKSLLLGGAASGNEELLPAAKDRRLFTKEFLAEINRELKKKGLAGRVSLSPEDSRARRGCILREGGIETDLSVDSLLAQTFDEMEGQLIEILFGAAE